MRREDTPPHIAAQSLHNAGRDEAPRNSSALAPHSPHTNPMAPHSPHSNPIAGTRATPSHKTRQACVQNVVYLRLLEPRQHLQRQSDKQMPRPRVPRPQSRRRAPLGCGTHQLSLSTPTTDGAWTSLSDVSHDGVTTHIETTHIEKHVSLGSHGLPHQTHGQHYKHKHLNGPNEQHRKQRDMAGGGGCRRGTRLCDSVESSERLLEPEGGQLLAHNTFSLVPRPGPQGDLAKRSPFESNPAPLSSFPPARSSLPHPHSRPHPLPRKKCAVSIPSALARPASISSSPTGREPRARDLMLCSTSKDGPREKEAAKQAAHARALRRKR